MLPSALIIQQIIGPQKLMANREQHTAYKQTKTQQITQTRVGQGYEVNTLCEMILIIGQLVFTMHIFSAIISEYVNDKLPALMQHNDLLWIINGFIFLFLAVCSTMYIHVHLGLLERLKDQSI